MSSPPSPLTAPCKCLVLLSPTLYDHASLQTIEICTRFWPSCGRLTVVLAFTSTNGFVVSRRCQQLRLLACVHAELVRRAARVVDSANTAVCGRVSAATRAPSRAPALCVRTCMLRQLLRHSLHLSLSLCPLGVLRNPPRSLYFQTIVVWGVVFLLAGLANLNTIYNFRDNDYSNGQGSLEEEV